MRRGAVLCLAILSGATQAVGAPCQRYEFELRRSISITELGELAASPQTANSKAGTIIFYPFDEEDAPYRHGLRAVGVVLASADGLGATPVGGVVWSTGPATFHPIKSPPPDLTAAQVTTDGPARDCSARGLLITFTQAGDLLIDGRKIGAAKQL